MLYSLDRNKVLVLSEDGILSRPHYRFWIGIWGNAQVHPMEITEDIDARSKRSKCRYLPLQPLVYFCVPLPG